MGGHNLRCTLVAASLVAASVVLMLVLTVAGLLAFIVAPVGAGSSRNTSMDELSATLVRTEGSYALTGREYLAERELWAMLVDEGGAVVWQQDKPVDVPDHYSLTDMATSTRWYLSDCPIRVRVREGGLLAAGGPKGGTWKYPFTLDTDVLKTIPFWFARLLPLALLRVLGLIALVLGRRFQREQQERDFARSDWINGISHDIRIPLSMVMGYAGQSEADPVPPPRRRAQVAIIRRWSQIIRDLVNGLNLTMRLDYAVQPLRRESLHPAALIRQAAADVLNGGPEGRHTLAVETSPETKALALEGDASLLRQALFNLVNNRMRHNPEGCSITLTVIAEGEVCILGVEDDGGSDLPDTPAGGRLTPDDGAAHSTGLRLVEQIIRAHGGALELHWMARDVLTVLRLPL